MNNNNNLFFVLGSCYLEFILTHYPQSIAVISASLSSFLLQNNFVSGITTLSTGTPVCNYSAFTCKTKVSAISDISFFYSNVRSLLPKIHLLHNYVSLYNPTVLAFSETWLNDSIPSSLFCPDNYIAYRDDRLSGRGGGTLILVKDNLTSKDIQIKSSAANGACSINATCCSISIDHGTVLGLLCIYRPPNSSTDDNSSMHAIISNFLELNFRYNIIIGDFNFPEIHWPEHSASGQGSLFLDFCQENFLTQHILSATRKESDSILDLVLSTEGTCVSDISVNEEFGSSDHATIQFSLNIKPVCSKRKIQRRNLNNVNWSDFRSNLFASDWNAILLTKDIDSLWNCFLRLLNSALDKVAPIQDVQVRHFFSSSRIRTALRTRRRLLRTVQDNPSYENQLNYTRSLIILKNVLEADLIYKENNIISNPNTKIFWSYVNRRLGRPLVIKSLKQSTQEVFAQDDISNILNNYFASTFTDKVHYCPATDIVCDSDDRPFIDRVTVTADLVYKTLSNLQPKTSIDVDGLSYKILKNGGRAVSHYLAQLYSLSLELCRIPASWKTAIVTPLFKTGDKTLAQNYRPVSVTSCCARVFERIINAAINDHLRTNNIIAHTQHGFQEGKSTDTALLQFYNYVSHCNDNRVIVDSVFFDFSKAFDTVPHHVLLRRLETAGIRAPLLHWIDNFLSDRFQKVRVGNFYSSPLPVTSGVIQGSVLGPTFFSIFVDDVDQCLEYCNIVKFADDFRIFLSCSGSDPSLSRQNMQADINNLVQWAAESGMAFNVSKSFSATFDRSRHPIIPCSFLIGDELIPHRECFRDLGVTVTTPLSFNKHMDDIVSKAYSRLGLIHKLFLIKSQKSVVRLYKSFVRPILEYSCLIWNPYTVGYINKIERVQKRMCRMIPAVRQLSYRDQLAHLNLHSLRARRIRYQLIFMFKLYKTITKVEFDNYFTLAINKKTRGHSVAVLAQHANNNFRLNFFTVSAIALWNKLSQYEISAPTLPIFKLRLHDFFMNQDIW